MRRFYWKAIYLVAILSSLMLTIPYVSYAQKKDRKAELMEKIKKLEAERAKLKTKAMEQIESKRASDGRIEEIIKRYENLLAGCQGKKTDRCADVIYTLGSLYYDQGRDEYVRKREEYERQMDIYEKTGRGPEPVNPLPDYSKSLNV